MWLKRSGLTGLTTFSEFLEMTGDSDRAFLSEKDLARFLPVCCGMANGCGGWIIIGAYWDIEEEKIIIEGLSAPSVIEERLKSALANPYKISMNPVERFYKFENEGKNILIISVAAAAWHKRPVIAGDTFRGAYRRIEGIDVLSGLQASFRLSFDAMEISRSDLPVSEIGLSELHQETLDSFREKIAEAIPKWRYLSEQEFLHRTLVLSDGFLTEAGYLMLGKSGTRVRINFKPGDSGEEEIFEVRSLWKAYTEFLPRLTDGLESACARAVRECFLNALIHAEHEEGGIIVCVSGDILRITNPGLSRAVSSGFSIPRNFRIMRMFQLAGVVLGTGIGFSIIRAFSPGFTLGQDPLELSSFAELKLVRVKEKYILNEPVISLAATARSDTFGMTHDKKDFLVVDDMSELNEQSEQAEISAAQHNKEVPDASHAPDIPEVPDVPDVPDIQEVSEIPEIPVVPEEMTVLHTEELPNKESFDVSPLLPEKSENRPSLAESKTFLTPSVDPDFALSLDWGDEAEKEEEPETLHVHESGESAELESDTFIMPSLDSDEAVSLDITSEGASQREKPAFGSAASDLQDFINRMKKTGLKK